MRRPENKEHLWNYKPRIKKICESCGDEFFVPNKSKEKARYCCYSCKQKGQSKIMSERNPSVSRKVINKVNCKNCDSPFTPFRSQMNRKNGLFCSYSCWHEYLLNNPHISTFWKGGSYNFKRGRDWGTRRNAALKRDNNTCQICYNTNVELERNLDVHHLLAYRDSKSNQLENLIVFCHPCHMKVHGLSKGRNDTRGAVGTMLMSGATLSTG
jgi:5-methylcytosine-specific restriction endonuclease McrA